MKTWFKSLVRKVIPRRMPTPVVVPSASDDPTFAERKQRKLDRLGSLFQESVPRNPSAPSYDYLSDELRRQFHIDDTENVSAHDYDDPAQEIIRRHAGGWVLDCGAGLRRIYYDNVVNYEICPYPTTDVRGVAERLPFRDGVFDAVFSFNVLEHVRDPFAAASELIRVLKPGGELYTVVPFLQPYHAFPHHYFNMTAQGLARLFGDTITIDKQEVNIGGHPVFMLTWVLRRWAEQLPPAARSRFLRLRVGELIGDALPHIEKSYCSELPESARFELAATTSLFGRKRLV